MTEQERSTAASSSGIECSAQILKLAYCHHAIFLAGVRGWHAVRCTQRFTYRLGAFAGGSGSGYITGFCDKLWRPGMSAEQCEDFVRRAVGHALARDGSSGGCIRTVTITKDGLKRSFTPNDKVCLIRGCRLQYSCVRAAKFSLSLGLGWWNLLQRVTQPWHMLPRYVKTGREKPL